jgi:Fic family protein
MAVKMSRKQPKEQIIKILSGLKEPVDFKTIQSTLNYAYAERTLRRWLSELSELGEIKKTGAKRGTRYQSIDNQLPAQVEHDSEDFQKYLGSAARQAIEFVKQPIFNRPLVAYNDEWLSSYQPNITYYLSADVRSELMALGKGEAKYERAGTYARQVYNRLLIDLSYNSSRLEGNTYSLVDTEKLIIEGLEREGKLDEERVMILNHKEAIRYLVEHAEKIEIDPTEICTLHYLLADGLVQPEYAGHVRDGGVRIGSSTYHPLENPQHLVDRLDLICQKAAAINDPFEQSVFLLAHIAYLQMFIDVNKRTSRLSANISLIKNNLVPLSFNDVDKAYYANAMIAIYELNNINALVDIFCFSYRRSCEQLKITKQVIGFNEIRVRYRQQRRDIIREIITQGLIDECMRKYIADICQSSVQEKDQKEFIKIVYEDLKILNPVRIRGMGVTNKQLNEWKILREKVKQ